MEKMASVGGHRHPLRPSSQKRGKSAAGRTQNAKRGREARRAVQRVVVKSSFLSLSLAVALLATTSGGLGDEAASSDAAANLRLPGVELDNSRYPEELRFQEVKRYFGTTGKTLFAARGTFMLDAHNAPPEAQLQLARLQLERLGEPTDVVDYGAKKLAAISVKYGVINDGGVGISEEMKTGMDWLYVGGTGSLLNFESVRAFCPEVRWIGIARIRGITRVFRLPNAGFQLVGLSSLRKKDFAVVSNDLLPKDHPEWEERAPVGAVLEMPPYCFVRFAWRERHYELRLLEADILKEDKGGGTFVETGERLRVHVATNSTDQQFKWKMGFFRFREIVEQRSLYPQHPLQDFLDGELQRAIKHACFKQFLQTEKRRTSFERDWTLRRCFFEMDRDALYSILGHQQWDATWGKALGMASTWEKGVEVYPNAVYLRMCLCGAKQISDGLVKEFVTTSYLYDNKTTVREWLLSGEGSLEIPNFEGPEPAPVRHARKCSVEELMVTIKGADAQFSRSL